MYELHLYVIDGKYVLVAISKGMYGLKQAGFLANEELKPHLAASGYHEMRHTHGLFKHESKPLMFNLIVDDFFIGYRY